MGEMKEEGYETGDLPGSSKELMESVLNDVEAQISSPELNVAYKMTVKEYEEQCPYAKDLEENWGPAPGHLNSDGKDLLIYGKNLGNIFIGVQPSFGYEGDPMHLLFSKSASPHHGFAAYYTYVEKVFDADAVLHFGTHGSLEFMPGKQVGMSGECYPDRQAPLVLRDHLLPHSSCRECRPLQGTEGLGRARFVLPGLAREPAARTCHCELHRVCCTHVQPRQGHRLAC